MNDLVPDADGPAERYRTALVIVNPISGRGQGAKAAAELAAGLRTRGIASEVFTTERRGDAFDRLRTLEGTVDLVFAVGGDGTVREVLDGLVDPATAVGILPFGTANVLAGELGLPRDVHKALDMVFRKRAIPVDVLLVNGRLATFTVGVGADAMAVREVERRRTGPITKWSYVSAVLRMLLTYRAPRLRVTLDGKLLEREVGLAIVSNTSGYGGVIKLARDARMDDGQLEVYLFQSASIPELCGAFVRGVFSHWPGGSVAMSRARSIRIESEAPVPYQVDGDLGGETPVEVEIAPNRYRLIGSQTLSV